VQFINCNSPLCYNNQFIILFFADALHEKLEDIAWVEEQG
jgi:hypothetical protein